MTAQSPSRFISNTVALVIQTLVSTLVTLAQVKLLANYLTQGEFGTFAALRGLSLLLSILAANGLPQLLLRFTPVFEARNEHGRALRLLASSLLGSVVLLLLVGVAAHALRRWVLAFDGHAMFDGELMLWFAATTLGVTLKLVIYGALAGLRRITLQVAIEVGTLVVILGWIVVSRHGLSVPLLFRIFGIVHVASALMGTFATYFIFSRSLTHVHRPEATTVSGLSGYLGWSAALSIVALAFTDVDRYLLAHLLAVESIAIFHIAARVGRLANRLLGVANIAFHPEVTRLHTTGRPTTIIGVAHVFIKFNSLVAAWMAAGIVLFARDIIVTIASPGYLGAAPVLWLLALGLPLTTLTAPLTTVMKARDQVGGALMCDLVWVLTYVTLMVALVPSLGVIGAGWANLGACSTQLALALSISRLRIGGGFVATLAGRLLVAGVVAFGPVLVVMRFGGLPLRLALFVCGSLAFAWLLRRLGFWRADEREALVMMMSRYGLGGAARLI